MGKLERREVERLGFPALVPGPEAAALNDVLTIFC
jgi:hypothetical protein